MEESTSSSCAKALLNSWIARFGIPEHITSDRGSIFTVDLWTALAKLLGVQLHHTTACHPQASGLVERYHRTLKASLAARCTGHKWTSHLPWTLLGIRTTPKDGLIYSSAEMVYGQPLVVPGEFFPSNEDVSIQQLRAAVGDLAPCRPTRQSARSTYVPPDLKNSQYVFVRTDAHRPPLTHAYEGPFPVTQRNDKAFQLQLSNKTDWVSIDRLKPAYVDTTDLESTKYTRSGRPVVPPTRFNI